MRVYWEYVLDVYGYRYGITTGKGHPGSATVSPHSYRYSHIRASISISRTTPIAMQDTLGIDGVWDNDDNLNRIYELQLRHASNVYEQNRQLPISCVQSERPTPQIAQISPVHVTM